MSYQLIDMTKDPRSGQFAYFRQMLFPFAGVTAEVDITDFAARRQGRPFFLSFLYAVVRAANAVPQLRRRIRADGSVVEYDWCPPSYTAMKPDGVYVYCTVEGDLPYESFVVLGQRRQEEVLRRGTLTEDGDVLSFFFVSSLPWLHYSQLEHPAVSADDSNPRISWGKAVTNHGRTTLPVSLFVKPRPGRRAAHLTVLRRSGAGASDAGRQLAGRGVTASNHRGLSQELSQKKILQF